MKTYTLWLAAVVLGLAAAAVPAAEAKDVAWAVSQAPADAAIVVAVRSLGELEASLKALVGPEADDLNIAKMVEEKLPAGTFDAAGPLVVVVPAAAEDLSLVVLMRLKGDAKLEGEPADGGLLKLKAPAAPPAPGGPPASPCFAVAKDGWAILGADAAAVKAVATAAKRMELSAGQKSSLAARMIWVSLSPKPLATVAKAAIEKQKKAMAGTGGPAMPEAFMKVVDYALTLLDQVETVALVADVKPEGVTAQMDVGLVEGSSLAAAAAAGQPVESFKAGLPSTDHVMLAVWARIDWAKATGPMKTLIKPLLDVFTAGADDAARKGVEDMWASYEQWMGVLGNDVALVMEPAPAGQGMYRLAETFAVKNPDEYRAMLRKQMTASKDFMKVITGKLTAMPGMPPMKMDAEYKEAAETIEGVPVDHMIMRMDVELPPDAPPQAAAQVKSMMKAVYGPDGMLLRFAVVNGRGVVALGDAAGMAAAIKAAKGQGPDLSAQPQVAAALGRIDKGASVAGVLSAGNYAYMTMSMMDRMMGEGMSAEVKEEAAKAGLKPLAPPAVADLTTFSIRVDGRTVRGVLNVPKGDIQAAIAAGKQGIERIQWYSQKQQEIAQKQMQQMQPGQPPAGAAPAKEAEKPAAVAPRK